MYLLTILCVLPNTALGKAEIAIVVSRCAAADGDIRSTICLEQPVNGRLVVQGKKRKSVWLTAFQLGFQSTVLQYTFYSDGQSDSFIAARTRQ